MKGAPHSEVHAKQVTPELEALLGGPPDRVTPPPNTVTVCSWGPRERVWPVRVIPDHWKDASPSFHFRGRLADAGILSDTFSVSQFI